MENRVTRRIKPEIESFLRKKLEGTDIKALDDLLKKQIEFPQLTIKQWELVKKLLSK